MGDNELLAVIANDVKHIKGGMKDLNQKVDKINGQVRDAQLKMVAQKTFCTAKTEEYETSIEKIDKKIGRFGKRAWYLVGELFFLLLGLSLNLYFKVGCKMSKMAIANWNEIEYFTVDEKWGDPFKMDRDLIYLLDYLRGKIGEPFVVHCGFQYRHPRGFSIQIRGSTYWLL